MQASRPILAFDFLDPWGWVALRRLAAAMAQAGRVFEVQLLPCRSSLGAAMAGLGYPAFLERRHGSEAPLHQSLVAEALRNLGVEVAFERLATVPDSLAAMGAVIWLQALGKPAQGLLTRVYQALYCQGLAIDDPVILGQLLHGEALALEDLQAFVRSGQCQQQLREGQAQAAVWAGRVIPSLRIDGAVVFGAQTPEVLLPLLR